MKSKAVVWVSKKYGIGALEVRRDHERVTYIDRQSDCLERCSSAIKDFARKYDRTNDPPEWNAKFLLGLARVIGASEEALDDLSTVVTVSAEDRQRAQDRYQEVRRLC